jgi:hypothetical protein
MIQREIRDGLIGLGLILAIAISIVGTSLVICLSL